MPQLNGNVTNLLPKPLQLKAKESGGEVLVLAQGHYANEARSAQKWSTQSSHRLWIT